MPEKPTARRADSHPNRKLRAAQAVGDSMLKLQVKLVTGARNPIGSDSLKHVARPLDDELLALSLEESVRAAFSPLDTESIPKSTHGNEIPPPKHRVRLKHLAHVLFYHPAMFSITYTPGLSKPKRRRRRHDALKRAIKAIPEIRREGSTKDSYYIYDSSAVESDAVLSAVLEQVIRYPPDNANDIISTMDMMDSDTLIDSLHTLEGESVLDFGVNSFELKPRIWEVSPGGKRTLTITLPEHTLNLFGELAARFTAVQEFITMRGHQGPVKPNEHYAGGGNPEAGHDLSAWQHSSRGHGHHSLPFPMAPMSKSMIVEIALWNLWKRHHSPREEPVDTTPEGLDKRSEHIDRIADDEFTSLVSRLQTLEEKLARL